MTGSTEECACRGKTVYFVFNKNMADDQQQRSTSSHGQLKITTIDAFALKETWDHHGGKICTDFQISPVDVGYQSLEVAKYMKDALTNFCVSEADNFGEISLCFR